uniref:Uncharacterized protein n=1 Tax=Romanomermis culicivorax TaxID=13658 RepID=A0A915HF51_ROMCU
MDNTGLAKCVIYYTSYTMLQGGPLPNPLPNPSIAPPREAEPALAYMRPGPYIKTKAPSTDMVYNKEFCQAAPGKDDHIHSAPLDHLPPVAQPFSFLDYLPKDYYDNSYHHYDPLGLSHCEEDSQIKTIVNNMHPLLGPDCNQMTHRQCHKSGDQHC